MEKQKPIETSANMKRQDKVRRNNNTYLPHHAWNHFFVFSSAQQFCWSSRLQLPEPPSHDHHRTPHPLHRVTTLRVLVMRGNRSVPRRCVVDSPVSSSSVATSPETVETAVETTEVSKKFHLSEFCSASHPLVSNGEPAFLTGEVVSEFCVRGIVDLRCTFCWGTVRRSSVVNVRSRCEVLSLCVNFVHAVNPQVARSSSHGRCCCCCCCHCHCCCCCLW